MTGSSLPHSSVIADHQKTFLSDVFREIEQQFVRVEKSAVFRGIFKTSLAAHAALEDFRKNELPLLKSASGIARRLPMLLACRQLCLAYVELRRFVEVVSWYPYFREHPVEWKEFTDHPDVGIVRDPSNPIRYAAHRELSWHHSYIEVRFAETAWIAENVNTLRTQFGRLSTFVHAALPSTTGSIAMPFDEVSDASLRQFQGVQQKVLSAGCLVVAAAKPASLAKMRPVERAWFDWLIGSALAKEIRASSVGAGVSRTGRRHRRS